MTRWAQPVLSWFVLKRCTEEAKPGMFGHLFDLSPVEPLAGAVHTGRGMVTNAARDGHR